MLVVGKSMNNLLSYCGIVDARISVSEKDLPVHNTHVFGYMPQSEVNYLSVAQERK